MQRRHGAGQGIVLVYPKGTAFAAPEPGLESVTEAYHTVEEIWAFPERLWRDGRKLGDEEEVKSVDPGVCITIPVGTYFEWRSSGHEPLAAIGVMMPPWPGEGEAYEVEGNGYEL